MRGRPGVSLTELTVALSIFAGLLTATLGFYQQQGRAFAYGNERMALMQNLRYGVSALEQNLRAAGVGVAAEQPVVVYAGGDVVAFNGDYATRDTSDAFAVYRDPRLPYAATTSAVPAEAFTIPGTTVRYPEVLYFSGSRPGPAETITFFFAPDATTARSDDHVLYRQVNALEPEIVARRLLRSDRPFFTYYVEGVGSGGPVEAIVEERIPAWHAVSVHGSPADTGAVALVDRIRAIEVAYAVTNGASGSREQRREIRRLIRLPNAGLQVSRVCGNRPLLGTSLVATGVRTGAGTGHVRLQWSAATDEVTGEEDVVRYILWRREAAHPGFGDPLVSLAPGSALYQYEDATAREGVPYHYALAAQDCTPSYSELSLAGPVAW